MWMTEGEGDFLGIAVATSSRVVILEMSCVTVRRKMPNNLQFLKSGAVLRRS